jgi:hypothetical protein
MSELPHNAQVLGKGGTFKVPVGGFHGWMRLGDDPWQEDHCSGVTAALEFACPIGSDVWKLNQPEVESEVASTKPEEREGEIPLADLINACCRTDFENDEEARRAIRTEQFQRMEKLLWPRNPGKTVSPMPITPETHKVEGYPQLPQNSSGEACASPEVPSLPNPFEALQNAPDEEEDVLEEALRITSGDRQNQYGPPDQDFTRTAAMWSALFGHKLKSPFEARDVAMAMICLKLSRETHQRKRDNAVDGAGYFRCLHLCNLSKKPE